MVLVNCQSDDFARLYPRAQQFPGKLQRQLRTQLRAAVRPAVREAQSAALALDLHALKPARYPQRRRRTGLRRGISNSVRLTMKDYGSSVEFRLRATHPMAKPTDDSSFRHPVFGNRDAWVGQNSRLWWTATMARHRPRMVDAGEDALRRALGEL